MPVRSSVHSAEPKNQTKKSYYFWENVVGVCFQFFILFCVVSCNCCYFYLSLQHYVYIDRVFEFDYVF